MLWTQKHSMKCIKWTSFSVSRFFTNQNGEVTLKAKVEFAVFYVTVSDVDKTCVRSACRDDDSGIKSFVPFKVYIVRLPLPSPPLSHRRFNLTKYIKKVIQSLRSISAHCAPSILLQLFELQQNSISNSFSACKFNKMPCEDELISWRC